MEKLWLKVKQKYITTVLVGTLVWRYVVDSIILRK